MAPTLTLDQIRNMLPCNKHRLDDELELQPDLMERISRQVVVMNSRALEAKDDLARIEGNRLNELKNEDPKLTVGQLEAMVKRDGQRVRAWQKYQLARADHEEWMGVLDAWRQKGFSLKTLADLHAANYFSTNSTSAPRDRASQDEARAALRRAHNQGSVEADTPVRSTRRRVEE